MSGGHHAISIALDGVTWSCSCGMNGRALKAASTETWAKEHVVDKRSTTSVARQTK